MGRIGLLHDIGKLEISADLLNKQGLTEEEVDIFKRHPDSGADVLSTVDPFMADVVRGHHKHQPNAYPIQDFRQTDDLRVSGYRRYLALCDQVDALMSKRSYKDAWPAEKVIAELSQTFEPSLVEIVVTQRGGM